MCVGVLDLLILPSYFSSEMTLLQNQHSSTSMALGHLVIHYFEHPSIPRQANCAAFQVVSAEDSVPFHSSLTCTCFLLIIVLFSGVYFVSATLLLDLFLRKRSLYFL